jgi:aspartyl-tRNA(Asn)/glutamyl-tRNA(Gln) amidotransferase subunit B
MEVHAQLLTESKLFCGCSTAFGAEPNTQVCPVCLGFPGVLPVLNERAVDFVVRTGLALNCEIAEESIFARKNYFYPDLPKAYQITQYETPLCHKGFLDIEVEGKPTRIGITRVHLEEDTARTAHTGGDASLVDYNRGGTPLMEIVTEPDIRSAEEAREYIVRLRQILRYLGVCDGNMEEGSLRCEPNVSIRPVGQKEFGTKVELKNLNSFRAVYNGLKYEIERQSRALRRGEAIAQETRRYFEETGKTGVMRSKESAHDYRYFPEPDLLQLNLSPESIAERKSALPELPLAKKQRFLAELGLSDYDATNLTEDRRLADYFEQCLAAGADPKAAANWLMGDFAGKANEAGLAVWESKVSPEALAELLSLIAEGAISGKQAKQVFEAQFETGKSPKAIVEEQGLVQISDDSALQALVKQVVADNADSLARYLAGNEKLIGFFVGQAMKASQGKANPQKLNELLKAELESHREG